MTKYSVKKILRKYSNKIIANHTEIETEDINSIDFENLISILHPEKTQQAICIKQIESLATMYQIYSKQKQDELLEPTEIKILYLLGYEVHP